MKSALVRDIDREVERRSLLKHPFYQMWSRGELELDHLSGYSKEYFQLVKAVPELVKNIELRAGKEEPQRKDISKNVSEETDHIQLWVRFASSLGISESELVRHRGSSKTREAVAELRRLSKMSFEESVASMYAYESSLPKISHSKTKGLKQFYGMDSIDATIYFDTHEKVDVRHAAVWRKILGRIPKQKEARAFQSAVASLKAQNKMLDAVMERYVN